MATERILSKVLIEPQDIWDDEQFWRYFLTYAFLQNFKPKEEKCLTEYMMANYPVDGEWVKRFTDCKQEGMEGVEFVKMISFHNMPGVIRGQGVFCYENRISYSQSNRLAFRGSGKRFLKDTNSWDARARLLLCPSLEVEKGCYGDFLKVVKDGLLMAKIRQEDIDALALMILKCCGKKVTVRAKNELPKKELEIIVVDEESEKAVNKWKWGFFLTALVIIMGKILFPTNSWLGREGLRRLMVSGFSIIPTSLYIIISCIVFWGSIYKDINAKEKEKNLSHKESGMNGLLTGFFFALPLMLIISWVAVRDIGEGIFAWLDYKNPVIESVMLKEPTFSEQDGPSGRYVDVTPDYYRLTDESVDVSFRIPLNYKIKEKIEEYLDEGVEIYYYKYSHVVQSIRCGDYVIVEGDY